MMPLINFFDKEPSLNGKNDPKSVERKRHRIQVQCVKKFLSSFRRIIKMLHTKIKNESERENEKVY